jgi:hypothetical protein
MTANSIAAKVEKRVIGRFTYCQYIKRFQLTQHDAISDETRNFALPQE